MRSRSPLLVQTLGVEAAADCVRAPDARSGAPIPSLRHSRRLQRDMPPAGPHIRTRGPTRSFSRCDGSFMVHESDRNRIALVTARPAGDEPPGVPHPS